MRKIEFNELKLKTPCNEDAFFQIYLSNLQKELNEKASFELPTKKYEIFYLNILDGKIVLLNKYYVQNDDTTNQELYYDYKIAYEVYNNLLEIYDGIENESNEFNELYKNERLKKDSIIKELKKQDEEKFSKSVHEYTIIKNSQIYDEYIKLKEENKKLKEINEALSTKKSNTQKNSFIKKIINKFKQIKKLDNGEK